MRGYLRELAPYVVGIALVALLVLALLAGCRATPGTTHRPRKSPLPVPSTPRATKLACHWSGGERSDLCDEIR